MTKNVTLRMDEQLLMKLRHRAVDERMSLSRWVITVLEGTVGMDEQRDEVRKQALRRLSRGFELGGRPLTREEAHAR